MNNCKNSLKYILDSLIILLNISNSYSIVPYLLFFQHSRAVNTGLIIIINTAYLLLRFNKRIFIKYPWLIKIYILICSVNVLSAYTSNTGNVMTWLYLIANSLFFLLLYNCYTDYRKVLSSRQALWYVARGYVWLSVACVVLSILLFVLLKIGLDPYRNEITNRMDLFTANAEQFNTSHYFPLNLSMLIKRDGVEIMKLPFFYEFGIICGLYHEPHIITFMVFPALFMLLAYVKKWTNRFLLFLMWIFIMLLTTSTMNIISFLVCIIVLLSYRKLGRIILVPLFMFLFVLLVYVGLENTELFFIADKLAGGSMDYSLETIAFAFTPKTFWGSNFMSTDFLQESMSVRKDVGYLNCFLNIIFLFVFIFNIVRALNNKDNDVRLLGIASLYFFLHSFKVSMIAYTLSMLIFICFILFVVNSPKNDFRVERIL